MDNSYYYDALDDIVCDLKRVMGDREHVMRKFEDKMAFNLQEESNIIRRLEHRIALFR